MDHSTISNAISSRISDLKKQIASLDDRLFRIQVLPSGGIRISLSVDNGSVTDFNVAYSDGLVITAGRKDDAAKNHYGVTCPVYNAGFNANYVFTRQLVHIGIVDGQLRITAKSTVNTVYFGDVKMDTVQRASTGPSRAPLHCLYNACAATRCIMTIGKFYGNGLLSYDVAKIIARHVYSSKNDSCWDFGQLQNGTVYTFALTDTVRLWTIGNGGDTKHLMRICIKYIPPATDADFTDPL